MQPAEGQSYENKAGHENLIRRRAAAFSSCSRKLSQDPEKKEIAMIHWTLDGYAASDIVTLRHKSISFGSSWTSSSGGLTVAYSLLHGSSWFETMVNHIPLLFFQGSQPCASGRRCLFLENRPRVIFTYIRIEKGGRGRQFRLAGWLVAVCYLPSWFLLY